MRAPDDMPRRERRRRAPGQGGRGRIVLIIIAIALFVLATSLRAIASFYTDYLWFKSVGQTSVWRGVLGTKIALALVFIAIFFVLLWLNLFIADRIAPRFRPAGPEEELIERYHELVGGRTGLVRVGVSLVFAVIAGVGASGEWQEWLLFRNRVSFGVTDPQFDKDVGFYVFQLPFLTFVVGWLFAAFTIIFIVTAVGHYMNGGIRVQTPVQRVTPQVKAHLSVLLAVLALVKLGGYYLQQFELTTSTRGTVDGATYTDVHAQLPAIRLLALISVAAAVLFIVNIWRRGWVLPVLGVGLWALVAVLAGGIVPALMQRFQVQPAESARERPYIERNIEATRQAYGLGDMETIDFKNDGQLRTADITNSPGNLATIDNIRLWDPAREIAPKTFTALARQFPFYNILDTDVDRYTIDGKVVQTLIATRELNTGGVPQQSWEGTHLAYTHGYGIVVAPSNGTVSGRPNFLVQNIPISEDAKIPVREPAVYFGEGLGGYVIVNTKREEIDFQQPDGTNQLRNYAGEDGIDLGSIVNKAAFALRFGDINPLFSGNLTGSSKILINRDIRTRVDAIAPFLSFDGDPYVVVIDGRVKWIVDGYTTTNRYPYAQRATTEEDANVGLRGTFNYVRNSVKAEVDAYDGTIKLHIVDEGDPLVRAYQKAFPSLFSTDPISDELRAHFRYPEELFRVQTHIWGRYHVTDPDQFYTQSNGWNVAPDPGEQVQTGNSGGVTTTTAQTDRGNSTAPPPASGRVPPYYVLMQLPDEERQSFQLLRSYVPVLGNSQQLTAFVVASSEPESYGRLKTFVMPSNNLPASPTQAANTMSSDPQVSELRTLLGVNTGGSEVLFGNLIIVPIQQSLLYVRPVYVQSTDPNSKIPFLREVIVQFGNNVAVDETLGRALRKLSQFQDLPQLPSEALAPTTPTGPTTPTTPTDPNATVADLLTQADRAMDEANAALRNGDLATYQKRVDEAAGYISRAQELVAGTTTTTTTAGASA